MSYHTLPDDHLRRRADYDLDLAIRTLTSDGSGPADREVIRMAHTLGAIGRVINETSVSDDPATATQIARIRARLDAYENGSEA